MSRPVTPIVCDGPGCGKQKQETNRWWTIEVVTYREPKGLGRIVIFPGTSTPPDGSVVDPLYDFCGETCALKFISEQMSKVTS